MNELMGELDMTFETQKERCELMASYIIEHGATVRKCASVFSVSKSTVHKDITSKLFYINKHLYDQVKLVLTKNKSERHLRGGEATKMKYLRKKDI